MTYNTRNPLGSPAVKDVADNSENFDRLLNDRSSATVPDRFGNQRTTYAEFERLAQSNTAIDAAARSEAARDQAEEAAELAAGYNNLQTYISFDSPSGKRMVDDVSQPWGTFGRVSNDVDPAKNGDYVMTGSGWAWADLQPVSASQLTEFEQQVQVVQGTPALTGFEFHNAYPEIEPLIGIRAVEIDASNRVFANLNSLGQWRFLDLTVSLSSNFYEFHNSTELAGVAIANLDRNDRVFFHFSADGKPSNNESNSGVVELMFPLKPLIQMLGVIVDGQSLSTGARGQPVLSTTQPYSNYTFGQGPRSTRPGGTGGWTGTQSAILLVENQNFGAGNGSPEQGETPCSGLANYFSVCVKDGGIDPHSVPVFASTAGHGGYSITQLEQGAPWLAVWRDHVTQQRARAIEMGKEYIVPALVWIQGEADGSMAVSTYIDKLLALREYQVNYVKATTGQAWTPPMLTYQSWANADAGNPAKAFLHLARNYPDKFRLVTPIYHLPRAAYASDATHLSSVGSKWMGAYFGRALADIVLNRVPVNFIMPGLPVLESPTRIRIPHRCGFDLQLSGNTPQRGYKVLASGVDVPVTNVEVVGTDVVLTLASDQPLEGLTVRYARDSKEAGLLLNGGAGDLCDTDPTTVVIDGVPRSLRSWCPSFSEVVTSSQI